MNSLARLLGYWSDAVRICARTLGPLIDLTIRLWIAEIYFVSGILKVGAWDTALFLSATEYPVSWLDPVTAAWLGAAIEIVCPLFLALGLATRVAALPMLFLALVTQFSYVALDQQLFWAAMLAWFAVRGPGPLSLDALVARGLGDTALPFAQVTSRLARALDAFGAPLFQLALRLWLSAALIMSALPGTDASRIVPIASASSLTLPAAALLLLGASMALGIATRLAAIVLLVTALLTGMADAGAGLFWWAATLALIAVRGPGPASLDAFIDLWLRRIFPQLDGKPAFSLDGLPRVVIVGAGFGGLACAAGLRRSPVQVTLIDRHNYHLFQPLLYQVATAGLSPGDIASTVRGLFREFFNVRVLLGTVTGIDAARRAVLVGEQRVPYDYLVLATGASHSYFGKEEWEPFAPGLKRVEDATEVRRRVLLAFEGAESTDDPAERQRLLTFLIVGGGPTGVELAGAIAELARWGMEKDFRRFDPAGARVILVQSGPRILPTFAASLSAQATRALEALGVEVRTGSRVEKIDADGVLVSGERIAARTVLWAAGVVASPAARWLGAAADSAGRVKVADDLSVPGFENVFAIGDTALSNGWEGKPVPGLAPAAKQGGAYVASLISARVSGGSAQSGFTYKHLGSLATIGRKAAVVDFGFVRLSGAIAWWLWGLVHVGFLVGLRNRLSVMFDWFWAYLTYRSGTRLITGGDSAPGAASNAQVARAA
ncbi:MAG TPA: FAD-dependent oxidoreductase [Steroidobacteraceae bacterium]|nr:FAD-dependent oxidoreductase [Steroidobacteraceae bacterium]